MGQKVSPNSLRFGIIREWNTVWIADKKDQAIFLHEDILIRKFLNKKFGRQGMISKITITRPKKELVKILVHSSRPGFIFGEDGKTVKETEFALVKLLRKHKRKVKLEINKIENPDTNAKLIAEWISQQLENRVSFRIAQKKAIQKAMRAGVKGIKTQVSGRLAGADMARKWRLFRRNSSTPHTAIRCSLCFKWSQNNLWNLRSKGLSLLWRNYWR